MSRRWFGDPADAAALGTTLDRLVGDVSRLLDRLERLEAAPVAPGSARVDPAAAAAVLPHRRIPGCSLVVQVAEWSASIGCWSRPWPRPRPRCSGSPGPAQRPACWA